MEAPKRANFRCNLNSPERAIQPQDYADTKTLCRSKEMEIIDSRHYVNESTSLLDNSAYNILCEFGCSNDFIAATSIVVEKYLG